MIVGDPQLSVADAVLPGRVTEPLEPIDNVTAAGAVIAGEIVSRITTAFVAVLVLPLASVAVIVIVLDPNSLQSKLDWLNETLTTEQLSEVDATTSEARIVAAPLLFNQAVTGPLTVDIDGDIASTITTFCVAVETLPFTSSTVIVTGTCPKSEQSKLDGATLIEATLQLSEYEATTSLGVILARPDASRANVGAVPTVVIAGAIASTIVTLNVAVA